MVEHLPAGAVFVDHQKLTINREVEEITGYGPDELRTVDEWFERLHREKEHRAIYERLRADNFQEISPPVELVRKDGVARMVKFACHRFGNHEVWLIYDLTEAMRVERELLRSQFALERIEESVVWVGQDQGRVLFANDAFCKMFGYDHEEILELGVPDFDTDISAEQWPDWWQRLKEEDYAVIERELITSSGGTFFAEVFPCHLDFGGEEFICVIIRDLTDRKQLEGEVLHAAEQEIIRISAELHDGLGSVLTGIKMGVTLLANKLRDHPALDDVTEISEHLGDAIRHSRQLAKGLQPVDSDPEALVPALSNLIEQLRLRSVFDFCRLEVPDEPVIISRSSVANQLYRIVQEATHNAVKHSKATTLTVRLELAEDQLMLSVLDNGTGIAREILSRDGLGLHIMNYRARMIGGALSVRPREDGGTEVRCVMPMPVIVGC